MVDNEVDISLVVEGVEQDHLRGHVFDLEIVQSRRVRVLLHRVLVPLRRQTRRLLPTAACVQRPLLLVRRRVMLDSGGVHERLYRCVLVLSCFVELSFSEVVDSHECALTPAYYVLHGSEGDSDLRLDFAHFLIVLLDIGIEPGYLVDLSLC